MEDFADIDTMLELRQRSKSSGSVTSGGYQAVDTDDEFDEVPILDMHNIREEQPVKSTLCECGSAPLTD